uniref:Peptidase M28 domain-containing protein n=1 Tax=Brassica campestris TaxID=3711 RepID=A0A3P6AVP8_BRACM|nr:unnamed protein product [Brassica rapa]
MEQTVAWMRWRLWWLLISTTVTDDKQFLDTFVSNQYVHSADSSCGNCCNFVEFPRKLLTGQDMSYKDQSILYEPIKELDIMLNQVNAGVSVDIISGVNDPAVFLFYSHRSVAFSPYQHLITPSDHVEIFTHLMWIISDFLELMVRKSMTFTSTQKLKASLILSKEH